MSRVPSCRVGLWLAVALAGCSATTVSDLAISRVEPDSGPNTADVRVRIEGSGFHLPFTSDLDRGTLAIGTVGVALDDVAIANVAWRHEGLIEGVVPAGLPIRSYDVTLTIDDRSVVLPDGYAVTSGPPLHLAPGDGMVGTEALSSSGNVTIDTTTLSISGATLPAGDVFDVKLHEGSGAELAVLHVGALDVAAGANVSIVGARPLVIVAGGDVSVAGFLDASANRGVPGPGGALPGAGMGAGGVGIHETSRSSDSGGGGGGYGQAGGRGGALGTTCPEPGGVGGASYGDAAISQLVGGSGGASSSGAGCPPDSGGAGGGALQISAAGGIRIDARGQVSGGGGGGEWGGGGGRRLWWRRLRYAWTGRDCRIDCGCRRDGPGGRRRRWRNRRSDGGGWTGRGLRVEYARWGRGGRAGWRG